MGCSGSKEGIPETTSRPGPIVTAAMPESEDDHNNKKTSTKTFDTHTTEASSYSGFRGSGPSFQSLPSTTGSIPRSEGGSDIGSLSLFSASSKRSGFGVGEKLSELSDEEGFEEDFEDAEERPGRGGGARAGDRPAPLSAVGAAPAPASRYDEFAASCYKLCVLSPISCPVCVAVHRFPPPRWSFTHPRSVYLASLLCVNGESLLSLSCEAQS